MFYSTNAAKGLDSDKELTERFQTILERLSKFTKSQNGKNEDDILETGSRLIFEISTLMYDTDTNLTPELFAKTMMVLSIEKLKLKNNDFRESNE